MNITTMSGFSEDVIFIDEFVKLTVITEAYRKERTSGLRWKFFFEPDPIGDRNRYLYDWERKELDILKSPDVGSFLTYTNECDLVFKQSYDPYYQHVFPIVGSGIKNVNIIDKILQHIEFEIKKAHECKRIYNWLVFNRKCSIFEDLK